MGEQDDSNYFREDVNHMARRRLSTQRQDQGGFQHDPNPQFYYKSSKEEHEYPKITYENDAYAEHYEYPKNVYDQNYESQSYSENPHEYQEENLHWYPQQDRDSKDASVHVYPGQNPSGPDNQEVAPSDVPHPYRNEEAQAFLSERRQGGSGAQPSSLREQPTKVSEFPYEFHKSAWGACCHAHR